MAAENGPHSTATSRCCKTCKFLVVSPDAAGRRIVRARNVYACRAPLPLPIMPDSVTTAYGFQWPMSRKYMQSTDGRLCPTWERYTDIPSAEGEAP